VVAVAKVKHKGCTLQGAALVDVGTRTAEREVSFAAAAVAPAVDPRGVGAPAAAPAPELVVDADQRDVVAVAVSVFAQGNTSAALVGVDAHSLEGWIATTVPVAGGAPVAAAAAAAAAKDSNTDWGLAAAAGWAASNRDWSDWSCSSYYCYCYYCAAVDTQRQRRAVSRPYFAILAISAFRWSAGTAQPTTAFSVLAPPATFLSSAIKQI